MTTATGAVAAPDERPDAEALDAYSRVVSHVAQRLRPSVVSLAVGGPAVRRTVGAGSAVVLTPDGFLLTSAHVVSSSTSGQAVFADGRELRFDVVGADRFSDLALLRVPASDLVPARLGDAATLRVGQLVVAVGSPLGYAGSVSAGIVSGLERALAVHSPRGTRRIDNVIQTDAALHPGSSGGALADSAALVIGVNTALVGPGFGQGLGLAVPIDAASRSVIASLLADGRVRRAYLGITGRRRLLPGRAAGRLGQPAGVELLSVVPGSPAAAAGLRPGDVLVQVDGATVHDVADLQRHLDASRAGATVEIALVRAGEPARRAVTPAELEP